MSDIKWRFPASGHGERKGISSGDFEAFKKSPFKAFAREILQNSIDARDSDEEPTSVEFKTFEIETKNIKGCEGLKDQIRRCIEFWAHKPDYVEIYQGMLDVLNSDKITCLRVSDYNTTGLIGVETDKQKENKFLALTKGTGVSEKSGIQAGGSKGVGKNAAFLMSSVSTVFYATRTNQSLEGEEGIFVGSIGVSELISGYVDDNDVNNRDYTQGTGYFSLGEFNSAIGEIINLEPGYNRNERCGTDIFIIGFTASEGWEKEIINSILDSFMSTIVREDLEVNINGMKIDKEHIKDIVYDDNLTNEKNKSNVISQYRLLSGDPNVSVFDIDTEYGSCDLYVLPFSKEEECLATHKCVMIRHPLMKIKEEALGASFRVSAMCIIGEGKLGQKLRDIENLQHIDWEPKRIKDKFLRKEIENVLADIKKQINQKVIECLQLGDEKPLDPNGAGDYLPDANIGESNAGDTNGNKKPAETVTISKPKVNDTVEKNATQKTDDGNALQPDIGSVDDTVDGDVSHPSGTNDNDGGGHHPGDESSGEKQGDEVIFKRYKLSGVRYKVISTNKAEGKLRVIFTAPIDFETCYLNLSLLDDNNAPSPVEILEMQCNGVAIFSEDKNEYGPFAIKTNQKIILDVRTNSTGYFGSEVKVICK